MSDYIRLIKKLKEKKISNLNLILSGLLGVTSSIMGFSLLNLLNTYIGYRWFNVAIIQTNVRIYTINFVLGLISTFILFRVIKRVNGYPDLLELDYQIKVAQNRWDRFVQRFKSILEEELKRETPNYLVNEPPSHVQAFYKYRNFMRYYINHSFFGKTFIYFYKRDKKVRFLINTDYCDLVSKSINKSLAELIEHRYITSFSPPTHEVYFKSVLYPIKKKGKVVVID